MLKSFIAPIAVACVCALNPLANAQAETSETAPINEMCPIGKEPIVPSAGTVEYKGKTIGLCCPGCGKQFLAWNETRKDEFVTLAVVHREPGQEHADDGNAAPAGEAASGPTYPYTLDACPVGGPLGSMGEPVVKVYHNREVRFCCAGCIDEFEANQAKYWGEIDAKVVEQQLMHYPIDTCIVTGEKLGDSAINHVHNNRLVRLGSAEAVAEFKSDPTKYLKALDDKIIEAQLPGYPMDNCPVGGPLGSMGEPVNFIYMNRLVRFCCDNCRPKLTAKPNTYTAKLDAAYAEQQRDGYALDTCVVSGAPLGSMGDPVELVAGTTLVRFCCENCVPTFKKNPSAYLSKLPQD